MPNSSSSSSFNHYRVVCLAGGVGGAKLAAGLAALLPPENLTIIVNTGDDFQHLGLTICPDLDTVLYTLAGKANPETGWGVAGESWHTITAVADLGGPDWFRLGDIDLATHLTRTHLLQNGQTLTAVTQQLCARLGIGPTILPMSDQPAPTQIDSHGRVLPFQTWFVAEKWQPPVSRIVLPDQVKASRAVVAALEKADIVIVAPSNPFVSIDPILNVYPIRSLLEDVPQLVTAVSPIVGGQALKGPAAKMMQELGVSPSATAVAEHYGDWLDLFIYDQQDAASFGLVEGVTAVALDTIMHHPADRVRLAQQVMATAVGMLSAA